MLLLALGLAGLTGWQFSSLPTGFLPTEDQGYIIVHVQLPNAASQERTNEVLDQIDSILKDADGIADWVVLGGYSMIDATNSSNTAVVFVTLDPWEDRTDPTLSQEAILSRLQGRFNQIQESIVFGFFPPAIPGLGVAGGFQMQIEDRSRQLDVLEALMMNRRLSSEVRPEGRPVSSGWMSSVYGYRTDPFSGRRDFHPGVDFAGKAGSDVLAVASGVVTWSGKRYNYGHMIEIDHGNGLVTRYGHNQENLVEVGEKVKKGQVIAKMGSSGRSTGPHVHLEVLQDGRKVNPLKYVR
jgi:hypothetical protein